MFSVEHKFDKTTVTLMDEGGAELREDVILDLHADGAQIEQLDPETGGMKVIELSAEQIESLLAAVDASEGVYHRRG
ncbi:hypothetical protein [Pseudosulfitobacter pseudonitzschiae]|uniref:hypothetical protein n=1 Tax=Pseudosulfitobacter pseudonitzschiae TaxID=1402135 RepID=UPI003B7768D3